MSEKQNIEYKSAWHDEFLCKVSADQTCLSMPNRSQKSCKAYYLKWVCGFANAIGGVIYIGKDDNGNVVETRHATSLQNNYARLLEDIPNKIRNTMGIICDVQLHEDEEKKYISIKVNPYTVAVSLRGRYNSRPRNPLIANACFFGGYIDTWGRGTLKIINACKEAGLPEPDIKEMNGGIEVTVLSSDTNENRLVDGLVDGLVESQLKIIELIKSNPGISKKSMSEQIGISQTSIDKHIKTLKEKQLIFSTSPPAPLPGERGVETRHATSEERIMAWLREKYLN